MLLSLMDWTVGIGRKLFKKDDQASSTLEQIILDGNDRYENLVGRFDVSDRVKSRVLDVPPEDVDMAVQAGAVFDEKEMALVVPEELDLDQFHPWWPKVPEDLRNTQARMIITKEGRRAEGFVLGDDMALGGDSTATSLMYLAFPLIGAVQYFLGSLIGAFSYVVLLAAIPYFVALKQAEGMKEAFKGLALMVLPVLIATASAALSSALHVDAASMGQAAVDPMNTGAGMMAVAAGFAKMAGIVLLILTIPGLLLFAAFLSAASHPHRGVLGGDRRALHSDDEVDGGDLGPCWDWLPSPGRDGRGRGVCDRGHVCLAVHGRQLRSNGRSPLPAKPGQQPGDPGCPVQVPREGPRAAGCRSVARQDPAFEGGSSVWSPERPRPWLCAGQGHGDDAVLARPDPRPDRLRAYRFGQVLQRAAAVGPSLSRVRISRRTAE
ncbi:TPA: hypothetical protein ACOENR_001966 [Stenotrophomonas maltophilia]